MARQILTKEIVNDYALAVGNKKIMRFVADARQRSIYPVPKDSDHLPVAASILGISKEELIKMPAAASHLIGIVMSLTNGIIDEAVIAGYTTITAAGIRYKMKYVKIVSKLFLDFIKNGEIPISKKLRISLIKDFTYK